MCHLTLVVKVQLTRERIITIFIIINIIAIITSKSMGMCHSYLSLVVKKVQLRFPWSWYTAPPPLPLLATGTPALSR